MNEKRKILVVDDDATVLEMIVEGLSEHNFEVNAINHPPDTLKVIQKESFRYALLDLDLGWKYMNGIELGQELKKRFTDIIVIVMTGYHNLKIAIDAMRKYSFHYLIKPFRIDQVISIIEQVDWERVLIAENERLKSSIQELQEENDNLHELLNELNIEDHPALNIQRDKNVRHTISNTTALRSYQRQKQSSSHLEKNASNVSANSDE